MKQSATDAVHDLLEKVMQWIEKEYGYAWDRCDEDGCPEGVGTLDRQELDDGDHLHHMGWPALDLGAGWGTHPHGVLTDA